MQLRVQDSRVMCRAGPQPLDQSHYGQSAGTISSEKSSRSGRRRRTILGAISSQLERRYAGQDDDGGNGTAMAQHREPLADDRTACQRNVSSLHEAMRRTARAA